MDKNYTKPSVPQSPRKFPQRTVKEREFTICGWHACLQTFEKRPQDILRLYFHKDRSRQVMKIKKWCAERKLPYRELDEAAISRAAASVHHEGLVMVVRPLALPSIHSFVAKGLSAGCFAVALDHVDNTHNVGAILRSCAFFGATGLLTETAQSVLTSAMARTAEGALDLVPVYPCKSLASALRDLQSKKVFVVGADLNAKKSLYETKIPFPCVVVVGNEHHGLSAPVKKRCDVLVKIPGAGAMESLNVSVSVGVLLGELARRQVAGGR